MKIKSKSAGNPNPLWYRFEKKFSVVRRREHRRRASTITIRISANELVNGPEQILEKLVKANVDKEGETKKREEETKRIM